MDVIGCQDRAAVCARQPVEPFDPRSVIAAIKPARRDVSQGRNGVTKPWQLGFEGVEIFRRPGDEGDAFRVFRDVLQ